MHVSPLFVKDNSSSSSMHLPLLKCTRECMQEALQLHYKRCYLYHLWEKLLASAVENADIVQQENSTNMVMCSSLNDNGWLTHLQEVVLTPLQDLNLRLRQLQEIVRESVQKVIEEKKNDLNGESSEFLNCSSLPEVKKANFFVHWIEMVQKVEREHFELLTKLGALLAKHVSESFLRGDQCEACLCRAKYEWKMYRNEVLTTVEAQKQASFVKDMTEKTLLHNCASPPIPSSRLERCENSTCADHGENMEDCHPPLENESASLGSQEPVENHSSSSSSLLLVLTGGTEGTKMNSNPLFPHERQCPHLSIHDLHSCATYRLLQRWYSPLHAWCGASSAGTSKHSRPSVGSAAQHLDDQLLLKVEVEEREKRKEALIRNPWAQRLRFVECSDNGYRCRNCANGASDNENIDENFMHNHVSEDNCAMEDKGQEFPFKALDCANRTGLYSSSPSFMKSMKDMKLDEMTLDALRDYFPVISISLSGEEQPLYPIGEEQEGEADDRATACDARRKKKKKECERLECTRHWRAPEGNENTFDSRYSKKTADKKGRRSLMDSRKSASDDEDSESEERNSSPYPRAMATYCPATVRHRCSDISKIIAPLLSSVQSTTSYVMELVEDLQCHLYDEDDGA